MFVIYSFAILFTWFLFFGLISMSFFSGSFGIRMDGSFITTKLNFHVTKKEKHLVA